MSPTPPKRPAPDAPDDEPASKRPAVSSPEEGELDDGTPPPPPVARSPTPTPAPKATDNKLPGVKFPFKTKAGGAGSANGSANANGFGAREVEAKLADAGSGERDNERVIYERSEEEVRKWADNPRRDSRDNRDHNRRGDRNAGRYPPPRPYDSYHPSRYDDRPHWNGYPEDRHRRDRGATRPPRDAADDLARTPSTRHLSPTPTPDRDPHRQPSHRSPTVSSDQLSPRRSGSFYRPSANPYAPDRHDSRHQYHREEDDYYWRQAARHRPPSPQSYNDRRYDGRRDRGYDPRRPRDRDREGSYGSRGVRYDSYRPESPPTARPATPGLVDAPPAPLHPLPPSLPPHVARSPPPLRTLSPLPPPTQAQGAGSQPKPPSPDRRQVKSEVQQKLESRPPPRKRRPPVRRTREEEKEAYGRVFVGCGQQDDYVPLTKLGEGTFGEVHKARQNATNRLVALKRILMHNEKEGMPVTALREIKILKALDHPSIIKILDLFVVKSSDKDPLSVYMVFPYMDHDLAGLLENDRVKLSPSQIKLYMKQLLEGTEYMHRNHILHRDMKAANLLIDNEGNLRIADFGLARAFDPQVALQNPAVVARNGRPPKKYTNCVVTRWYRPPELLLGARHYGGEIDLWGIGCVLGEMFNRQPILAGTSDIDQLDRIWKLCGTPNQHTWPNYDQLPGCEGVKQFQHYPRRVKLVYEDIVGPETADLLDKLLTCNPRERITASQALDHDYFWSDPLPADPKTLPKYEASHEYDKRGRRHGPPAGPPMPAEPHVPRALPPPTTGGGMRYGGHPPPPPPRDVFRHAGSFQGPPPMPFPPPPQHFGNGPPGLYPPPGPPGYAPYPPGPHSYGGGPPPPQHHRGGRGGYGGRGPPRPPSNASLPARPPQPLGPDGRPPPYTSRDRGGAPPSGRPPPPEGGPSSLNYD
ncbi:Pkinase-domain-containing protein [Punctularia strigosozonata HHB-11173 SS5]|uniref:Pkinase-domain-containing protein n=1 Tax=Punctularia strigosozonata (strain HHB-11173) TaxID=741275 RepID=UPI0004416F73|nr:Pkinase-domain-containing protein [Punctularia strigosozonata HHB-11173 SS5]EIN08939.1 Pkinase-domain-containing protein [Punctularia strigosozonata HHB-11173 SS5]